MENNKTMTLQDCIEQKINVAYAKFGGWNSASVTVRNDSVEIWFNTEKPYLGAKFWDFLDEVADSISEPLRKAGYQTDHESQYLYSLLNWKYKKF